MGDIVIVYDERERDRDLFPQSQQRRFRLSDR